jgi:alpha-glucuronidase
MPDPFKATTSRCWSLALRTLLVFVLTGAAAAAAAVSPASQSTGGAPLAPEDGYELWLRYRELPQASQITQAFPAGELIGGDQRSATLQIAESELLRGLAGLMGHAPHEVGTPRRQYGVAFGTPQSSSVIARCAPEARDLPAEGYLIRLSNCDGRPLWLLAAGTDVGVLYASFHFLRLLQTGQLHTGTHVHDYPRLHYRILDHWDNPDRSVERGYAGESLWDWQKLPGYPDPRYTDYARACASIGINSVVLNNVNASAVMLTDPYLRKLKALADIWRPYGLRVFLSARFSAPLELGGLPTADPADPRVRSFWKERAAAIYALIPDFGGFLVKANSEGQPGPQDYHRSHADGANMLAAALAPYGGIVMWRAFVYQANPAEDRARQAFAEFAPLDGQFADNVLLQVKNGPIDFQPREPFHPLFGRMPHTPLMLELQITKEYLGFATHLVYLGTLFQEVLRADTQTQGPGTTVAQIIADPPGSQRTPALSGMAGVANIGSDRNWTGSHFDQANWYAFGRLAWNPELDARDIAEEWVRQTFSEETDTVNAIVRMMMSSREAAVNYMTPLGLHHQMADSHYGPAPWNRGASQPAWSSVYFNKADAEGIGFDRTASGTNAVAQYAAPVAARFSDLQQTPEELLLWFHHLPWDYRLRSGHTLWDELVMHYSAGVDSVVAMRREWQALQGRIDARRHADVAAFLAIQEEEARWWRDASIAWFQSLSHRPLPSGYSAPAHDLRYYQSLCFPYVPGAPHVACQLRVPAVPVSAAPAHAVNPAH